jgi:DNA-binding response OmpR family regulator
VVARVKARLRNPDSFQAQVLRVGQLEMDLGRREVKVNGTPVDLTPSEFNLLHVLMEQAGYVFTRSELVNKGLGSDYEGLERTLDSHIRNLRRKIEPDVKTPTYIETVYGVGYRLGGESK